MLIFPPVASYIFYSNDGATSSICTLNDVTYGDPVQYGIADGKPCQNDEARSMRICEGKRGTKLTVYDNGDCKTSDDWAVLTINRNFHDCIKVDTFEDDAIYGPNNEIYVDYGTSGNLDGKISCLKFEL